MAKSMWWIHALLGAFAFAGVSSDGIGGDATEVPGKNVSVSEVTFDSSIEDIHWAGDGNAVVFVRTSRGRLYRSRDGGRHWKEITDIVKGADEADPFVSSVIVSPKERRSVVILSKGKKHFFSADSGATFRPITLSGNIHSWHFHPSRQDCALVSSWTDACMDPLAKGNCIHLVYLTRDGGKTFDKMDSYVVQFSWGDPTNNTEDHIYFTSYRDKSGNQNRSGGWSHEVDFSVTRNFGHSYSVLVPGGNKHLLSHGYIFVATSEDLQEQTVRLMVSTDAGQTFNVARLPVEIQEKAYTILDASEGAVMIHVNHGNSINGVQTGHVYISDEAGLQYSLSLPNNVRSPSGECEFDRVASLDGVYIANFLDQVVETKEEESAEAQTDQEFRSRRAKSEDVIRTVVTFDKGGIWSYLKPPRVDSRGNPVQCKTTKNSKGEDTGCYLHLHGITQFKQFAPFYSVENALGLVMGIGNVGSHLRFEPDEANTYISRDGGRTWIEAHKGAYIYEFGDHGGLIVMADDLKQTDQVVFSWNEGQSWFDFQLSGKPMDVDNIVIEPKSSAVDFMIYGTRDGIGQLYHLDFATLGQPACRGASSADSVSSDYETWQPADGRSGADRCILGRQITYTRRKQTSECFNGRDFERPKVVKACACTEEDYECEFGFARKVGSSECRPTNPELTKAGCTSASYFMADAYRKIPGDRCIGGWTPPKVAVPCPAKAPFSGSARLILAAVLLLILALIVLTYITSNATIRNLMQSSGFDTFSAVRYAPLGTKPRSDGRGGGSIDSEPDIGDEIPSIRQPRPAAPQGNKQAIADSGNLLDMGTGGV